MADSFDLFFKNIRKWEGGLAERSPEEDSGGLTKHGVTFVFFKETGHKYLNVEPTKEEFLKITWANAKTIARKGFWEKRKLEKIKKPELRVIVASSIWMSGYGNFDSVGYRSIKEINEDDSITPQTLYNNRLQWLKKLSNWKFNSEGWTNRLNDELSDSLSLINGDTSTQTNLFADNTNESLIENNKQIPEKRIIPEGYIVYVHTYSGISTLTDLIEYKHWYDYKDNKKPTSDDLLNEYGNRNSIREAYSKRQKKQIPEGKEGDNLTLGAKLKIPAKFIDPIFIAFDGNQIIVPNDDTETFISEALQRTVKGIEYRQVFKAGIGAGIVQKSIPKPRVWIWCKSLGFKSEVDEPRYSGEGEIFDLSLFIMNLQISVGANGGNFSFSLPPLTCQCEVDGWKIKSNTTSSFTKEGQDLSFVSKNDTHKQAISGLSGTKVLKHNTFLFHNMISENDIVFISFDDKNNIKKDFNLKISTSDLAGQVHDMIGLVDANTVSQNFPSSNANINISGRDFIKPMIEDSSYFLNLDESLTSDVEGQKQGLFLNDNPDNWGRPTRNSMITASSNIVATSMYQARTVGEFIEFIFSSLATIEICPDSVFSSYDNPNPFLDTFDGGYGISRYSFYDTKTNKVQQFKAAGIWQIIKIQVDPEKVSDRYVVNTTFPTMSGSLLNAIKVFIDGRFIEMMSDTYLDQFFFVIRRPPYNKKAVFDYINKLTNESAALNIDASQVISDNFSWYRGEVYSWYRLNTNFVSYGKATNPYLSGKFRPIVFFREYCEIWGNKALDVETNYQPFEGIFPSREGKSVDDPYNTQVYEDLAYLVETNAYLPFTRTGTITIKQDRRIKRGIWFRYLPTGEVFYIDSVSHGFQVSGNSLESTTTLQVSRGMVEYNDNGDYILPLYFKIIDGLPNTDKEKKPPVEEKTISEPFVIDTFFDFDIAALIDLDKRKEDLTVNDVQKGDTRQNLRSKGDKNIEVLITDLKNDTSLRIVLTGHTDSEGSEAYNQRLGQARADNIKNIIIKKWSDLYPEPLNPDRIETQSKGETEKRDKRDTTQVDLDTKREIYAVNRRVECQYVKIKTTTPENGSASTDKKSNDYSKWSVNQGIFNFFKTRRQFCGRVSDIENVGTYKKPNPPEPLKVEENPKKKVEKDEESEKKLEAKKLKINVTPKTSIDSDNTKSKNVRIKTVGEIQNDKKNQLPPTPAELKAYNDLGKI